VGKEYNRFEFLEFPINRSRILQISSISLRCVIPVVCVTRWEGGSSSLPTRYQVFVNVISRSK